MRRNPARTGPAALLPHLSPLNGHWTTATIAEDATGQPVEIGIALLPGIEWPYPPETCPTSCGTWHLNGELVICEGCGADGT
ncbi:hypothetical protein ABZ319_07725 [Nocardia sp. NPDC005978]|uniref:hypothetical protein n=1 Tax=Nocardia sp. NPDC005978 TaxID=3156725 RepID=UPI0033A455C7